MESLIGLAPAIELLEVVLPMRAVQLRALRIAFSRATPNRLREGTLAATYTSKPLVSVDGAAMFGELAILRWLEKDGWEGVWVDSFHGGRLWRAMPHRSSPVRLPWEAGEVYTAIKQANGGKASGAFDVMAWRQGQFTFVEYKAEGDRFSRSEAGWIEAALAAGIVAAQLWLVLHPAIDQ
jgi:hypothetical protein